jgi:thioredoxin reductase (NADPH)
MSTEEGTQMCSINKLEPKDFPVIFFEDGTFVKNPTIIDVAAKLALTLK